VVTGAETAEEHPAPVRIRASTPARDEEAARTPPRAVLRRRKTELRLPCLLKKGGSPLHPEQRPLRQRAPLAEIKVQ